MQNKKKMHLYGILFYAFVMIWAVKPQGFDQGMIAYKANDFEKAYQIWLPLAEQGERKAQYHIGHMLSQYAMMPEEEACKWLLLACEAGYPEAHQAVRQLSSRIDTAASAKARQMAGEWMLAWHNRLLIRASEGEGVDQMLLGLMHSTEHARLLTSNDESAPSMFQDTQIMLGMHYFDHAEEDKNTEINTIHTWFVAALQNGGGLFDLPQSTADAAFWYESAADQGIAEAQLVLAIAHILGREAEVDFVAAYKWILLATRSSQGYVSYIGTQLKHAIQIEMSEDQLSRANQHARQWHDHFEQRASELRSGRKRS